MSCCIGARLAFPICNLINIFYIKTFWGDSAVVLWDIKIQGEWWKIVPNRGRGIRL